MIARWFNLSRFQHLQMQQQMSWLFVYLYMLYKKVVLQVNYIELSINNGGAKLRKIPNDSARDIHR